MIKYILPLLLAPGCVFAQTFQYEQPAALKGKVLIIKSLHPNPDFRGEKQPAIALSQPVVVDGEDGRVETKLIQLMDNNSKRYSKLLKSNGASIYVECESLFREHTGHHTTKVLCVVDDVYFK